VEGGGVLYSMNGLNERLEGKWRRRTLAEVDVLKAFRMLELELNLGIPNSER
jgi:hypothetical protein